MLVPHCVHITSDSSIKANLLPENLKILNKKENNVQFSTKHGDSGKKFQFNRILFAKLKEGSDLLLK